MTRIVIVSHRRDRLARLLMENVYSAVVSSNFDLDLENGDIICWLPLVNEPVDDEVQKLAQLVDRSLFPPRKIVMLSMAGTADDAAPEQLQRWYGRKAQQFVWAHQYAIKMIDELELPYVIVRTLPLTRGTQPVQIVDEGQKMDGQTVTDEQLARVLQTALTTTHYDNHSIGVMPKTK